MEPGIATLPVVAGVGGGKSTRAGEASAHTKGSL